MKHRNLYVITLLLLTAGLFVWWGLRGGDNRNREDVSRNVSSTNSSRQGKTSSRFAHSSTDAGEGQGEAGVLRMGKALAIPPGDVKELADGEQALPARVISPDDAILAAGGLTVNQAAPQAAGAIDPRKARLKSILAKDWEGQGNLLVNELRAARGFEVPLQTVEDFFRGKDLFGWPDGQRNWIGDEMMTALRQEMPQQAYQIFSSIQADATAPEAMRDYSIQHISHLITDGHVGSEGVALIRAAYESGNPVLAGTALISLHRLSEKSGDLISPNDVQRYAEQSKSSQDERLKMTAQAILKEGE